MRKLLLLLVFIFTFMATIDDTVFVEPYNLSKLINEYLFIKNDLAVVCNRTLKVNIFEYDEISQILDSLCDKYNIDKLLVLSIILHESGFDYTAKRITSKEHSVGLMQVNKCAHPKLFERYDMNTIKGQLAAGIEVLSTKSRYANNNAFFLLYRYNGAGKAAKKYAKTVYKVYQIAKSNLN